MQKTCDTCKYGSKNNSTGIVCDKPCDYHALWEHVDRRCPTCAHSSFNRQGKLCERNCQQPSLPEWEPFRKKATAYEEWNKPAPKLYQNLGESLGKLTDEKQEAYGDSFGKSGNVLREMYPDGIKPDQYDDALAIVRIVDKLFRIATKKDAFGESPYRDIVGYGLLGVGKDDSAKNNLKD